MTNRKTLCFLALFLCSSCASLPRDVHKNVHSGDSQDKVEQSLGTPDYFQSGKEPDTDILVYVRRSDFCEIYLKSKIVTGSGCWKNQRYVNPVGAVLKGAGDGLVNGSKNQTHCTTTGSDGLYNTNCN